MENKEILELIRQNASLSANMENVQKDLNRLINLIEKDIKQDIEDLDERLDSIEKSKEKINGVLMAISFVWTLMYGLLLKFGAIWFV